MVRFYESDNATILPVFSSSSRSCCITIARPTCSSRLILADAVPWFNSSAPIAGWPVFESSECVSRKMKENCDLTEVSKCFSWYHYPFYFWIECTYKNLPWRNFSHVFGHDDVAVSTIQSLASLRNWHQDRSDFSPKIRIEYITIESWNF